MRVVRSVTVRRGLRRVALGSSRLGNRLQRLLRVFCSLLLCAFATTAHAQLTIEIIGGSGSAIPVAIVPFDNDNGGADAIASIVAADLSRSGLFREVSSSGVVPRPARAEEVRTADWRARGADAVVVGTRRPTPDGRVEVRFALVDAVKNMQLATVTYNVAPGQLRATAHKIADVVYEKLTGDVGVFSTRIAYITKQG